MTKQGLSGYCPVRNFINLDYCAEAAVGSLLPICDEVVVSCADDSSDGTIEFFQEWAKREPKIRVVLYPWPDPVADIKFLIKWLNWTREQLSYNMQIFTAADEVICDKGYKEILDAARKGECRWFKRLNFWKDHRHILPDGYVVGTMVAQLGPSRMFMPADDLYTPEPEIRRQATNHDSLRIFHYGFIRESMAFYRKSRVVQRAVMNMMDPRLAKCEAEKNLDWVTVCDDLPKPLRLYLETHPPIAHEWLKSRGYTTHLT